MYNKPISYSGLKLFKQRPKRFHHQYVLGNKEPSGKAAERGTRLHDLLEKFFLGGEYPNDPVLEPWRGFMEELLAYDPTPEAALAVTEDWAPCAFDDPAAYYRGKADLMFTLDGVHHILDWKSGKKYDEHKLQGESYVAMSPSHEGYRTCFVYLDSPLDIAEFTYTPEERIQHIAAVCEDVDTVRSTEHFEANPGDACRWCPLDWRKGGECKNAP